MITLKLDGLLLIIYVKLGFKYNSIVSSIRFFISLKSLGLVLFINNVLLINKLIDSFITLSIALVLFGLFI